jgi:hypothetical protein
MARRFISSIFLMTILAAAVPDLAELNRMIARFAPAQIRVDTSGLAPGDREALAKILEAARVIDDLFVTQLWSGNAALAGAPAQGRDAAWQGSSALFRVEQRAMVGSGRACGVSPGCASEETRGRELLSGGHDARGVRSVGQDTSEGSARASHGLLHRSSEGLADRSKAWGRK